MDGVHFRRSRSGVQRNPGLSFGTKLPWEGGNVIYSVINTLARELAFLAMWLTRQTSFAVSAWMGDPPTRYTCNDISVIYGSVPMCKWHEEKGNLLSGYQDYRHSIWLYHDYSTLTNPFKHRHGPFLRCLQRTGYHLSHSRILTCNTRMLLRL